MSRLFLEEENSVPQGVKTTLMGYKNCLGVPSSGGIPKKDNWSVYGSKFHLQLA
jgi:hypothetical protein